MLQFDDIDEDNIKNEILNTKSSVQYKKIGKAFISKLIDLGYHHIKNNILRLSTIIF